MLNHELYTMWWSILLPCHDVSPCRPRFWHRISRSFFEMMNASLLCCMRILSAYFSTVFDCTVLTKAMHDRFSSLLRTLYCQLLVRRTVGSALDTRMAMTICSRRWHQRATSRFQYEQHSTLTHEKVFLTASHIFRIIDTGVQTTVLFFQDVIINPKRFEGHRSPLSAHVPRIRFPDTTAVSESRFSCARFAV